ncbi:MAG: ABC transporter permease [Gammaproteobacteria bacterium]|nr:ABC transporter permease [Gammaproteobacteria bacterium]
MSWQRFYAILVARNREFIRDRAALSWNILFPVLIVAGFAFAFSDNAPDQYKVGVYVEQKVEQNVEQNAEQYAKQAQVALEAAATRQAFFRTHYIQFIPVTDRAVAITKVERHQLDMVYDLNRQRYWINSDSPKGYLLERVLRGADASAADEAATRETVSGREIRYVDWVITGVLGMNMMFSALFGVGYVIVRYRKNGVLKRLNATPLTALEFLTAQVVSRLWLILAITVSVYVGANLFIDFSMFGSYWNLLLVAALGAVSMISLGLMVAARVKSEELAGGLLNILSWPMMFLSGVWFSLEGAHPFMQKLAAIFPLTHLISAARAVMLDGAGLWDIAPQLATLGLMSIVFLILGSWFFRWQ